MKLKECPHCGGEAEIRGNYSHASKCYFFFVKCSVCGAQGKTFSSGEDITLGDQNEHTAVKNAIKAWNMRYNGQG